MLHDFVALMVVWLGPFAAVWITDGVMRRWRYDPEAIHDLSRRRRVLGPARVQPARAGSRCSPGWPCAC